MWPFKRETRLTVDEYIHIFEVVSDKVVALNEEARLHNMVESGLLPQGHLTRKDSDRNLLKLQLAGHADVGRTIGEGSFREDADLCARDE